MTTTTPNTSEAGTATPMPAPSYQSTPDAVPPLRPASPVDKWTEDQWDAFYADLRALQKTCGPNQHDQIFVLINACLDEGINTIGRIIRVLAPLKFERTYVAGTITRGIGQWCRKDKLGILTMIPA